MPTHRCHDANRAAQDPLPPPFTRIPCASASQGRVQPLLVAVQLHIFDQSVEHAAAVEEGHGHAAPGEFTSGETTRAETEGERPRLRQQRAALVAKDGLPRCRARTCERQVSISMR